MGQTSVERHLWRRHLESKMAAPEMTSSKTWGGFLDPHWGGGGKWRPFRFRSPSWMTSFPVPQMRSSKMAAGSGRAAIFHLHLNGGPKNLSILLCIITLKIFLKCTYSYLEVFGHVPHDKVTTLWCGTHVWSYFSSVSRSSGMTFGWHIERDCAMDIRRMFLIQYIGPLNSDIPHPYRFKWPHSRLL